MSIMVRPDNGDDRMHLVVLAAGHAFRHGAAVGPGRVRVADVGDPAFQEAARGRACRRPIGIGTVSGRLWADGARVGVEYDGEPRGHQRGRRMLPGGTGGSAGNRVCG